MARNRDRARDNALSKRWRLANPDRVRANKRRQYARQKDDPEFRARVRAAQRKSVHGPGYEQMWQGMWDAQDGKCYLCGDPLIPGFDTHIDHDHTCCPKGRTCSFCRRGLACTRCNKLIGAVDDDFDLLHRIAANLEPVLKATRARIATKPKQDALWEQPDLFGEAS